MATIWNDPEFIALEAGPQRLYMFLLSQPDLSHAGLVPMRIRRWAKKVADYNAGRIEDELATLEHAGNYQRPHRRRLACGRGLGHGPGARAPAAACGMARG